MATNGNDTISGGFGNDVINGLGGDDTILGLGGTDTLSGNDGNDFLKGGEGNDLLFGGAGDDRLVSGEREPAFVDGFPLPQLDRPDGGDDFLGGGGGNDLLIVTTDSDDVSIDGGTGIDTLQIGFSNTAVTNLVNNTFDQDLQNAIARIDLAAGTGRYLLVDTISAYGTLVDLTLAIAAIENVNGSAFREFISGNAAANVIDGKAGDDTLQGRGGADTLDGGSGQDRAIYDNSVAIDIDLNRASQLGGEAQGDILVSIENIDGSRFNDIIRGNFSSAINNLFGNFGNDILEGRGGADVLNGGGDRDRAIYDFSAAINIDLTRETQLGGDAEGDRLISIEDIDGSRFADVIRGNSASNRLDGQSGNDTINGREGNDTLLGGGGNDVLSGSIGNDVLLGGSGDDVLDGGFNSNGPDLNTLDGEAGIDTATFVNTPELQGFGVEVILGLNGADGRAASFFATDTLRSIENVIGSSFEDIIVGNEQDNNLSGGNGDDTLRGGESNDVLDGGRGINILDGEGGLDTVSLANSAASVVTLGLNGADGSVVNFLETDTLRSIENVIGSIFADTISGNEQANNLDGGNGNDTLRGGENNDVLNGSFGHDLLDGEGGIDTVTLVNSGASVVNLGQNGGDGSVVNLGEIDTLRSIENVIGSIFTDQIFGNEQANNLDGDDGNDTLDGRGGLDVLSGGVGNDTYLFSGSNFGADLLSDEAGTDTAKFDFQTIESIQRVGNNLVADLTGGTFTVVDHFAGFAVENATDALTGRVVVLAVGLTGGDASGIIAGTNKGETLDGRGGDDLLYGNAGRDTLLGGDGNDLLNGGKGQDVLEGGNGDDTLVGGKGNDIFVFACGSGNDVIADFDKGHDRIDLTAFDTTFRALDDDRDGKLEDGEGAQQITVEISQGDTLLTFAGGSIRIDGVVGLGARDFLL